MIRKANAKARGRRSTGRRRAAALVALGLACTCAVVVILAMISPGFRHGLLGLVRSITGKQIVRVTLPEGWNRFQIASRLAHEGIVSSPRAFLDATEDPGLLDALGISGASAEGYLYPDTYDLYKGSRPEDVVRDLVSTFRLHFAGIARNRPVGSGPIGKMGGQNAVHAAVILASIVEEEAVRASEQPVIASVLFNRLLLDTFPSRLLQVDPSVSYGCAAQTPAPLSCGGFDGHLRRAHLADVTNPYNTYVHPGLPPGPICNPGPGAIAAVLEPAQTDYLYFVSKGDGTHQFSVLYEEHRKAVEQYRQ